MQRSLTLETMMTAATAVYLESLKQNEFRILSATAFQEHLERRLGELTGIPFPYRVEVPLYANHERYLRSHGYSLEHKSGKILLSRGDANWHCYNGRIVLTIRSMRTHTGARIDLNTEPGSVKIGPLIELLTGLQGFGVRFPPAFGSLCGAGGTKHFGWETLGLEPHTTIYECFSDFADLHPGVRKHLHYIFSNLDLTPFDPSPLVRNGKQITSLAVYVPESSREALNARWRHQWNRFLKSNLLGHVS